MGQNRIIYANITGDVPVCDPRKYYECVIGTKKNYVKDNEASKCNCPRQCHRFTYEATISQAKLAPLVINFMKNTYNLPGTMDEIINDYCFIEVCKGRRSNTCYSAPSGLHTLQPTAEALRYMAHTKQRRTYLP